MDLIDLRWVISFYWLTVEFVPEITRASCVRASARRCYAGACAFEVRGGGGTDGVHALKVRDFGAGRQAERKTQDLKTQDAREESLVGALRGASAGS